MSNMKKNIWINEFYTEDNDICISLRITDYIYKSRSKFQSIDIVNTSDWGKVFFLDNIVMTCDKYEFIYHEMITHVPLFAHPNPKKVLIIGGGDGGTAREILKHKCIEKVDMVEIDEEVIEASRKYLGNLSCSFDDKRLNLIIGDGIEFVKNKDCEYDLAIVDSTDPFGPAEGLFNEEFYRNLYHSLKDDGFFVCQSESPFYYEEFQKKLSNTLKRVFPNVYVYTATIPMYPGSLWTFTMGSKKIDPKKIFKKEKLDKYKMKYYNYDIHQACFALPEFVKKIFE